MVLWRYRTRGAIYYSRALTLRKSRRARLVLNMNEEKEVENKDLGEVKVYEIGFHITPNVAEEDVERELSPIHDIISELGGSVISEGAPVMRPLSYEIAKKIENKTFKFSKAYFGWVKFEIDSSKTSNITSKLEVLPNILRFILVKTVRENTIHTPKIPMFKKDSVKDAETPTETSDKPQVSEEELDKSIDDLVIG